MNKLFRLITIEWLKNASYKPVIVFGTIYLLLLVGFGLICSQSIPFFGVEVDLVEQGLLEFPQLWNFLFYMAGIIKIFLGLIIMFTVTNEFTEKLFKQNLIDGLSKKEYLISKVTTIILLSFISTLIVYLTGMWLGYKYSTQTSFETVYKEIYFVLGYFLKLVNFLLLFLLLSVLLKRIVLVLMSFFVLWVVEIILRIVEFKLFVERGSENFQLYNDYFPLANMHKLVDYPFERIKTISQITQSNYVFETPWSHVFLSIGYSIVFIYGTYLLLLKKDW